MRPFHVLLAVLVAAIWGGNFVFIMYSLHDLPPVLLGAMRFFLTSIPAIFFIKRPNIPLQQLFWYAMFMFAVQFTFLFLGLAAGMPAGLASLVAQVQVFFSAFFAALFLKEKFTLGQFIGALVAFLGILLVIIKLGNTPTLLGFSLVIIASVSWGAGNLYTRLIGPIHVAGLVAWGCFLATPPMFLLSMFMEGWPTIVSSLSHVSWLTVGSLSYIAYISTWIAYSIWSWLLNEYTIVTVAPFTMLVPVFGMICATVFLHETMESWKLFAALLILFGLAINVVGLSVSRVRRVRVAEPS